MTRWRRATSALVAAVAFASAWTVAPLASAVVPSSPVATHGDLEVFSQPGQVLNTTATDLNVSGRFPQLGADPVVAQSAQLTVVAGVTSSGALEVSTTTPQVPLGSAATNVSATLGLATLSAVGRPLITPGGGIDLAVVTTSGHLLLLTSSSVSPSVFTLTDLTTAVGMVMVTATPDLLLGAGGALQVFCRASTGDLVQFEADDLGGHLWDAYDLTAIAGGVPIVGTPSAQLLPDGGGIESVLVAEQGGAAALYTDDDSGYSWWSLQHLGLPAGTALAGSPSLLATSSGLWALGVSTTGAVLSFSATGPLGTWSSLVLTPSALGLPGSTVVASPPVLVATTSGIEAVARSTTGDLDEISKGPGGWRGVDLSYLASTEELVAGAPSVASAAGAEVIVAQDAGPIALGARIVLTAASQDQNGAKVVETPLNSNCNPYTAFFARGTTTGCKTGTAAEEWCSDFAQWVWTKAGVNTTGITGYSFSFVNWGEAHGTFKPGATNNPKVGDAVVWGVMKGGIGDHVGLIAGVKGNLIDVIAGNAGPVDAQGSVVNVWDSGYIPETTTVTGTDSIVGYISPLTPNTAAEARRPAPGLNAAALAAAIARQDGGR